MREAPGTPVALPAEGPSPTLPSGTHVYRRSNTRLRLLFLLTGLGGMACASTAQTYSEGNGGVVQATVMNESVATITAYVVWSTNRTRLGEVGPNRQRVFITPLRGNGLAIGFEAIGAPPAGTGDARQEQYGQTNVVSVASGDEVECTISLLGGGCSRAP